jgi:hypothetical protein
MCGYAAQTVTTRDTSARRPARQRPSTLEAPVPKLCDGHPQPPVYGAPLAYDETGTAGPPAEVEGIAISIPDD